MSGKRTEIAHMTVCPSYNGPYRSSSALKAGRREVAGSIPSRACRPSRSEFSVIFYETRINTD